MHQTALVALVHPIQKISLGGSRKIEKVHDFGNDFPSRVATQRGAADSKELDRAGVVVIAAIEQRSQWPAVNQYV